MEIVIHGSDEKSRETATDAALAMINTLEQTLSTWREDSELMVLNRERSTNQASQPLLDVVKTCEAWLESSNGAFSCRLGQVIRLWDAAEASQQKPIVPDMLPTARAARENSVLIDNAVIELGAAIDVDPSGLAKGYIIDQAMAVLKKELPDVKAIKLDIGGDASYWGAPPGESSWQVNVANPLSFSDNANFITTLGLNGMAVATSGHESRSWRFGEQQFSKILDSRRGWPVVNGLYSVVIAPDAITADATATTLATLNPEMALNFINNLEGIEALIIDHQGNQFNSEGWQEYLGGELHRQANSVIELTMEYTIPNFRSRDYERPYLAIWVGDTQGRPIKNLLILGSDDEWARTNSVWWSRVGRREVVPVSNVTRPTRAPGKYDLIWDGREDNGSILLQGEYQLMIEASREHGGHNYISIPFNLGPGMQEYSKSGEGELGDVKFSVNLVLPE